MSDNAEPGAAAVALHEELVRLAEQGEAAIVVAAGGDHLLWATPAGASLIGQPMPGDDGVVLDARVVPTTRLATLAAELADASRPRLERMRVTVSRQVRTLTWMMRGVRLPDGTAALLAVELGGPRKRGLGQAVPPVPARFMPVAEAPVAAALTIEALRERVGGRAMLRFVWHTDSHDRLTVLSDDMRGLVDCPEGSEPAAALPELVDDAGADLGAALAARTTFRNVPVLWPVGQQGDALAVTLSGAPVLDRTRSFAGFQGFGMASLDALRPRPVVPDTDSDTAGHGDAIAAADDAPPPPPTLTLVPQAPAAPEPVPPRVEPPSATADEGLAEAPSPAAATADEAEESVETAETTDAPADALHARDPAPSPAPAAPVGGLAPAPGAAEPAGGKVVPLRTTPVGPRVVPTLDAPGLSRSERHAFREIARALGARLPDDDDEPVAPAHAERRAAPPTPEPAVSPAPDGLDTTAASARDAHEPTADAMAAAPTPARDEVAGGAGSDPTVAVDDDAAEVTAATSEPVEDEAATEPFVEDEAGVDGPTDEYTVQGDADENETLEKSAAATAEPAEQVAEPTHETSHHAAESHAKAPDPAATAPAPAVLPMLPSGAPEAAPAAPPRAPTQEEIFASHAQDLFDRLPVGVMVSRGDVVIHMNRTLLDLLGYEDADQFHAEGGLPRLFRGRASESLVGTDDRSTIGLMTRDGETVPVNAVLQSIQWDGLPATLMSFRRTLDQDVAPKLKALELDLRRRETEAGELRAILDTATDGVVVMDDAGRILSINKAGEALFGYDQREVAGETFITLFAPDSHAPALDYLEGLKANGVASVLNDGREVIGRVRQGGRIPLFMTLGAISEAPERKFCAVLRDITAWKKAETDLLEAKRAAETASAQKSDFLAKISHEVRTPLSAIMGFAEVMIEERFGPVGNERYLEYLRDIHSSGKHVISLVNDLLDLSKIEAGRFDLDFVSVDVNEIVSRSVALMQPQAGSARVVLRTSLPPRLPRVVADERSLHQIVLNILSNAVKFTDPGGQVIVSTAFTDRGEVAVRVRDTGIGMTEKEIETALEPFRQIATARRAGGTGLGLPLTKALVEANRASLTIRSARDAGTLVEVTFPTTRVLAE